tara:strand:- start:1480 stop:2004 length:525 start_codon:yes stop_codon:yes gene_type:complete
MERSDQHLLIDGYNMIHGISHLRSILRESAEAACDALVQMARTIHDEDGARVTIVFDGREKKLQVEHPCRRGTFSVLYAPRQLSADGVIEQMLERSPDPSKVTVASRDNMIREAAAARGSFSVDEADFEDWVGRCERRTHTRLRPARNHNSQNTLGDLWATAMEPEGGKADEPE